MVGPDSVEPDPVEAGAGLATGGIGPQLGPGLGLGSYFVESGSVELETAEIEVAELEPVEAESADSGRAESVTDS